METEWRVVTFSGKRSATYPLTWGQKWIWNSVESQAPRYRLNVASVVDLPPDCSLDDVLRALSSLVARHEALRTRFHVDERGIPGQALAAEGEFTIEVHHLIDEEATEYAESVAADLSGDPFTMPEISIRASVVTLKGAPAFLVLVLFHMAADAVSAQMILSDLKSYLRAYARAEKEPVLTEVAHPLDRVRYEQSPEGRERSQTSVRKWLAEIENFPEHALPLARHARANPVVAQIYMRSKAVHAAAHALARHHGVSTRAVILTFAVTALCRINGTAGGGCLVFSHNRFDEDSKSLSCTLVQSAPMWIDVSASCLRDILKNVHRRSIVTSATADLDPDDVSRALDDFERRHGRKPDLSCTINLAFAGARTGARTAQVTPLVVQRVAEAVLAETEFGEQPIGRDPVKFYLYVQEEPEQFKISFRFHTEIFSLSEAREYLEDIEREIVRALTDDHWSASAG